MTPQYYYVPRNILEAPVEMSGHSDTNFDSTWTTTARTTFVHEYTFSSTKSHRSRGHLSYSLLVGIGSHGIAQHSCMPRDPARSLRDREMLRTSTHISTPFCNVECWYTTIPDYDFHGFVQDTLLGRRVKNRLRYSPAPPRTDSPTLTEITSVHSLDLLYCTFYYFSSTSCSNFAMCEATGSAPALSGR